MRGSKSCAGLYLFVNHDMSGIGGGQRYVLAKSDYLLRHGWNVAILHVSSGEVILDTGAIKVIDMPALRGLPQAFGKNKLREIKLSIMDLKNDDEEVIVESSGPHLAIWGEYFASCLNAVHFCYILEENPKKMPFIFFKHKVARNEIAFISDSVAEKYFQVEKLCESNPEKFVLRAYNPDPIDDVFSSVELPNRDYLIGSLTRLEKPYVEDLMSGVIDFCNRHHDSSVLLCFIGDTNNPGVKAKILRRLSVCENLTVIITGYLTPVPLSLINKMDVMVCKAGAAAACARAGVLTIGYYLTCDKPAGFLGYDFPRIPHEANAPSNNNLADLLEMSLVEKKYLGLPKKYMIPDVSPLSYEDHFVYFSSCAKNRSYFDVFQLNVSLKKWAVTKWIELFGNTNYEKIVGVMSHGICAIKE